MLIDLELQYNFGKTLKIIHQIFSNSMLPASVIQTMTQALNKFVYKFFVSLTHGIFLENLNFIFM